MFGNGFRSKLDRGLIAVLILQPLDFMQHTLSIMAPFRHYLIDTIRLYVLAVRPQILTAVVRFGLYSLYSTAYSTQVQLTPGKLSVYLASACGKFERQGCWPNFQMLESWSRHQVTTRRTSANACITSKYMPACILPSVNRPHHNHEKTEPRRVVSKETFHFLVRILQEIIISG